MNNVLNTLKSSATSTKNFVVKHKTALAVTATAAAGIALNVRTASQYNEFLKEKGLFEEFMTEIEIPLPNEA